MWPRCLPGSRTLSWVTATALHLALIFSMSLQRPNKPALRKQLLFLHFHSGISIKMKLKIITSRLLCCRASCQRLTLHHLGWRNGPEAPAVPRAGGRELSVSGERKKF